MCCPKCGQTAEDGEDPQVENLRFSSECQIEGTSGVKSTRESCGSYRTKLEITIQSQVPITHRGNRHQLEIEFEAAGGASTGYPLKIRLYDQSRS